MAIPSSITNHIPHLPKFNQYGTGRKLATCIIALAAYPLAQTINAIISPLLGIYGCVSLAQQFFGQPKQWSQGHRVVILSSCPFIGAIYMAFAFAGKILD